MTPAQMRRLRPRCACGWLRPLIAVVRRDGEKPSEDLVPLYFCPQCDEPYFAGEVTPAEATRLLDVLARDLAAAILRGDDPDDGAEQSKPN